MANTAQASPMEEPALRVIETDPVLGKDSPKKQWKKPAIKNTVRISSITKGSFGPSVFDGSFTS